MADLSYITNEFARTWVQAQFELRRGVFLQQAYIDIDDGHLHDAILFSQIMYWHEPSRDTGRTKLTIVDDDGNLWLAKNHADWFGEARLRSATVRKCLERLKERNLIFYEIHGFMGQPTPHIRVNWAEFERRMRIWIEYNHGDLRESEYDSAIGIYANTSVLVGHTPDTTGQGSDLVDQGGLIPQDDSNTEITPETTSLPATGSPQAATPNAGSHTGRGRPALYYTGKTPVVKANDPPASTKGDPQAPIVKVLQEAVGKTLTKAQINRLTMRKPTVKHEGGGATSYETLAWHYANAKGFDLFVQRRIDAHRTMGNGKIVVNNLIGDLLNFGRANKPGHEGWLAWKDKHQTETTTPSQRRQQEPQEQPPTLEEIAKMKFDPDVVANRAETEGVSFAEMVEIIRAEVRQQYYPND